MDRRQAVRILKLAGAVSIPAILAGALLRDEPSPYTIRSEVRLVLLDVAVTDPQGRPDPRPQEG
jgi:hypothetical protein